MTRSAALLILLPLAILAVLVATFSVRGEPVGRSREAEMRAIAATLACPVCQGLSVADSPSQLAQQMRAAILDQLAAGSSKEQIIQFFVDRYGEGILFDPPKRGFGLLIWWVPVLGVLAGTIVVGLLLARWVRRPGAEPGEAAERDPPLSPSEITTYRSRLAAELARQEGGPAG